MAFYDYRGEENILRFCNLLNVNCSDTFVSSHACKQEDCCDFDNNVSVTLSNVLRSLIWRVIFPYVGTGQLHIEEIRGGGGCT